MSRTLVTLLLSLVVVHFDSGHAARLQVSPAPLKEEGPGFFREPTDLVCGSTEIRTLLAQDHRNIQWTNIFGITDSFLQSQAETMNKIKREMYLLKGKIEQAKAHDRLESVTPAKVRQAIIDSVVNTPSCGSVDAVKDSACGDLQSPRVDHRCWVDAPRFAQVLFTKLMSNSQFIEKDVVAHACKLEFNAEGCSDFCHALVTKASAATNAVLGGPTRRSGLSSDKLRLEYERLRETLLHEEEEHDKCSNIKETLESFEKTFRPMESIITIRVVEERNARNKMWDAEELLENLVADVNKRDIQFKRAEELLGHANESAKGASASFHKATEHTAAVTQKQAEAMHELNAGTEWLTQATAATKAAETVRLNVVSVMMWMLLFFDDAVRRPLNKMGIDNVTNFADKFPATKTLSSRAVLLDSLSELKGFCTMDSTTKALSLSLNDKDYLDTPGLCSKLNDNLDGDMNKVVENVESEVNKRTKKVVEKFTSIQSWLLDTRFMSPDRLAKAQAAGELKHLREVASVMNQADLYKHYITHWRFDEMFEKSVARLDAILERAEQRLMKVTEEFGAVAKLLEEAHVDEVKADEELKRAIITKALSEEAEKEAHGILCELLDQRDAFASRLAELTEAAKQAKDVLEGSKNTLKHAHAQALSFAQLLQSLVA